MCSQPAAYSNSSALFDARAMPTFFSNRNVASGTGTSLASSMTTKSALGGRFSRHTGSVFASTSGRFRVLMPTPMRGDAAPTTGAYSTPSITTCTTSPRFRSGAGVLTDGELAVTGLVPVLEADLAVELDPLRRADLGERLHEEVTLARDLEEHGSQVLEGRDHEGVRRHVPVEHDVAAAEVRLERLQVHATDVAGGLPVVRLGDELAGQGPLGRRVDDDRASLALLQAARLPHALHEVEQVVTGERVPPARDGLDVRRDRLEQTTGLPGVGVVRGAGVGARDERLLDVAGDLLELLVDRDRKSGG